MATASDLLRRASERGRPRGPHAVFAAASASRPAPRGRALVAAAVVLAVLIAGGVVVASDGAGPGVGPERAEVADPARRTGPPSSSGAAAPPAVTDAPSSGSEGSAPVAPLDDGEAVTTRLESHATCDSLLGRLRELGSEAVGPHGFQGEAVPVAGGPAAGPDPADGAAGGPGEAGGDAGSHSRSNVQEPGVDEPDLLKTDGDIVVAVARERLQVVSVGERSLLASTALGFRPESLLLANRTAVVVGATELHRDGRPETPVALVSLEDPRAPSLRSTTWIEGVVRTARLEDGMARLVVADSPRFDWRSPSDGSAEAEASAERENRRLVETSELPDWLPDQRTVDPSGRVLSQGPVAACRSSYTPAVESGFDTTTVVTLDPASGHLHPGTAVTATPYVVYATSQSLYVVSSTCCLDPGEFRSDIHRFDLAQPTAAPYRSSGSVLGAPIGQFALSERDGHLRVATSYRTDERGPDAGDRREADGTDSAVWVLAERGQELALVGHVAGLGKPGEVIFAVRYHERFAYLVTFRRVDPLYVVDLGDPAAPTVLGELEIPGFSSFLQPVGRSRLMGVGQSMDPGSTEDSGLQLSLFDVSDPAAPTRTGVITYPRTYSAAEHDHLAFLHWEPEDLVVVPFSEAREDWQCFESGALVLRVDGGSVSEVGRVSHAQHSAGGDNVLAAIHRAAVAGGSLLTVSDVGIAFGDLRTGAERAFVTFAGSEPTARHSRCPAEQPPQPEDDSGGILPV